MSEPLSAGPWPCEAYGPEGIPLGALCFFTKAGRVCASPAECHEKMTAERQRIFGLIHQRAAEGDETMAYLAGEFTSPEQILGGGTGEER